MTRPLDPTWWCKHHSGEYLTQQDDAARLVKRRTGRKVTAWILYIGGEYRGEWPTLAEAKRRALELTEPTT